MKILSSLLDDEVALLPAERRERFFEHLTERARERDPVRRCGRCKHLFLAMYAPDDGRCRECGEMLGSGRRQGHTSPGTGA